MTTTFINTTIEILGKSYPIRCPESELVSLQQAATFLNDKMNEVQDAGKTLTFERMAIITALNIASQYLQLDQQKNSFMNRVNQRILTLQDKLDSAVNKIVQTEFAYTTE